MRVSANRGAARKPRINHVAPAAFSASDGANLKTTYVTGSALIFL
jgi:hypothetical protein